MYGLDVAVTGGSGFIGRHLVAELLNRGARVTVLDFQEPAQSDVTWVQGDIRDRGTVYQLRHCSIVFNLAAESNVMRAVADPDFAWSTSVKGAQNVLGLRNSFIVHASSREVYGEPLYTPVDEKHPLMPKNIYGASKKEADEMLRGSAAVLRLSNVIGIHDPNVKRVVPAWLTAAAKGEKLTLFGGTQSIDFIPVETVVRTAIAAAQRRRAVVSNVGSGKSISLLTLAEAIAQLYPNVQIDVQPARSEEVTAFVADTSVMQRVLNISPPQDPLAYLPQIAAFYAQYVQYHVAA